MTAITRREALRGAMAVGGALAMPAIVPASAVGRGEKPAASERITLGVIGFGRRCEYDLNAMLKLEDVQCRAICDVRASRRTAGKQLVDAVYGNDDCDVTRDMQALLDRSDIDAVLIATGDRWHAPASILAAEAGKDVYSEKPVGLTIELCQKLAETCERTGRVFQAGTQRRNVTNFQIAVKLAQTGKLGNLQTMYASVYQPVIDTTWLPGQPTPAAEEVDWDAWLGPAPWRPYNERYVQGRWRGQWDFDSGAKLLDWGAHTLDLCQWANQADDTMPVEYEPHADQIIARYANGVEAIMTFLANPGRERPGWNFELGTCPVRFIGDEGSIETGDNGGFDVSTSALKREIDQLTGGVGNIPGAGLDVSAHARDFFDCVKSRSQPACNPTVMRRSHIACHAAALSWILGRKLILDPVREEFVNDPEANSLRSRPERAPYTV